MSLIQATLKKFEWGKKLQHYVYGNNGNSTHIEPIDPELPLPFIGDLQLLYENIELALKDHQVKVITFASSTRREGSSTIAIYYTLLLAKRERHHPIPRECIPNVGRNDTETHFQGKKVLLVDCNFKHPSLHKFFNLENRTGLTELIEDNLEWERVIRQVEGISLQVITMGRGTQNSVELLSSIAMKNLMEKLRQDFNYIVIDAPPIVPFNDTLALAKLSDGVVLVVRAGETRLEVVQQAKAKLIKANMNILGVALNRREYFIPKIIYERI